MWRVLRGSNGVLAAFRLFLARCRAGLPKRLQAAARLGGIR